MTQLEIICGGCPLARCDEGSLWCAFSWITSPNATQKRMRSNYVSAMAKIRRTRKRRERLQYWRDRYQQQKKTTKGESMDRQQIEGGSNIVSAGYDPATRAMHIEFKSGATYEYDGIKPDEWGAFEATFTDEGGSTGGFFAQNFRGRKGTKLEA